MQSTGLFAECLLSPDTEDFLVDGRSHTIESACAVVSHFVVTHLKSAIDGKSSFPAYQVWWKQLTARLSSQETAMQAKSTTALATL